MVARVETPVDVDACFLGLLQLAVTIHASAAVHDDTKVESMIGSVAVDASTGDNVDRDVHLGSHITANDGTLDEHLEIQLFSVHRSTPMRADMTVRKTAAAAYNRSLRNGSSVRPIPASSADVRLR